MLHLERFKKKGERTIYIRPPSILKDNRLLRKRNIQIFDVSLF